MFEMNIIIRWEVWGRGLQPSKLPQFLHCTPIYTCMYSMHIIIIQVYSTCDCLPSDPLAVSPMSGVFLQSTCMYKCNANTSTCANTVYMYTCRSHTQCGVVHVYTYTCIHLIVLYMYVHMQKRQDKDMRMCHVRSCEVAQGLRLAHSQSSTSKGWGVFCNHQNIPRQLLTLFVWDVHVLQMLPSMTVAMADII